MDMDLLTSVARLAIQVSGVLIATVLSIIGVIGGMFAFFNRLNRERLGDMMQANKQAHDGIVKNIAGVETRLREDSKGVETRLREDIKEVREIVITRTQPPS